MACRAGPRWSPQWQILKTFAVAVSLCQEVAALSFIDRHPLVAGELDAKHAASKGASNGHLQEHRAYRQNLLSTGHNDRGGGSSHHSIFELDVSYVDNLNFWCVLGGMLAFTICVDRVQDYCEHWAQDSAGKLMLWRRVSSELMMFGIVAISIFVATNLWSNIPEQIYLLVEFVDIFISCGCCGLIGMCAILLFTTQVFAWQIKDHTRSKTSTRQNTSALTHHHIHATRVGNTEHAAMVKVFFDKHPLPPNFDYNDYVKMVLMRNCCNIMSVHWATWGLLVVFSALGAVSRLLRRQGVAAVDTYLLECVVIHWVICLTHVFVMLSVYRAQHSLLLQLRDVLQHPEKELENPFGERWADRVKWVAQICAVINAFLTALFVMHELFNLDGHGFMWYLALLSPLLFDFFIALPFIVSHIAFIEAFYVMDADAMDFMLEELDELETDMRSVRTRWIKAGKKQPEFKGCVDIEGLCDVLKELGIHCSESRCRRIFKHLDEDESGDLSVEEFMISLEEEEAKQGSKSTSPNQSPRES